jgi:hypothetical protein
VTSVVRGVIGWHNCDQVNEMLQLVVIEATSCLSMVSLLVDQLVIQVFELLQAVFIFKKFVDSAFLAGKYLLN